MAKDWLTNESPLTSAFTCIREGWTFQLISFIPPIFSLRFVLHSLFVNPSQRRATVILIERRAYSFEFLGPATRPRIFNGTFEGKDRDNALISGRNTSRNKRAGLNSLNFSTSSDSQLWILFPLPPSFDKEVHFRGCRKREAKELIWRDPVNWGEINLSAIVRRENCLRIQVEKKFVARISRIPFPGPLPFLEIKCKFLYYSWQFRLMSRRPSNYFPTSYVAKRTSLLFVLEIFFNPFQRGEQESSFEEQWSILFNFLLPEEERFFLLAITILLFNTFVKNTRRGKARYSKRYF